MVSSQSDLIMRFECENSALTMERRCTGWALFAILTAGTLKRKAHANPNTTVELGKDFLEGTNRRGGRFDVRPIIPGERRSLNGFEMFQAGRVSVMIVTKGFCLTSE